MLDPASPAPPSEADWHSLVLKAGGSLDALRVAGGEGWETAALQPRSLADACAGFNRDRMREGWTIAQRVDDPDPERANATALADLEGGADALTLVFAGGASARGHGIMPEHLDAILSGVELDLISLRLDPGTPSAIAALAHLVDRRRLASAALNIDCCYDPIGMRALHGAQQPSLNGDLASVLAMTRGAGLGGRPVLADGRPYHEAGADTAQELAAVLATGLAYLRGLERAGESLADASAAIAFCLAVDADLFEGLAKVRAMRRLWARIEDAAGLSPRPIRLHAETAWRSMAKRDALTNVMRATAGAMAAGLGGADCVSVLPHTLPVGLPDESARRLARNVGLVLIDEARLGFVEDAAAGAGGPEAMTQALCERAWALFQDIEREGGIEASLAAGLLQMRLATTAAKRADDVARGSSALVGVNFFPSLAAPGMSVTAPAPPPRLRAANALPSRRDAEAFEALRDAAERLEHRPTVFLATLGAPAVFGPRAVAAANVFAAGGMAALVPTDRQDTDDLVRQVGASRTAVACLCGSDEAYAAEAAAVAGALRAAGARHIILAGDPGPRAAEWRLAGVDAFLHDGCALTDLLESALQACAVATTGEPARP